MFYFFNQKMLEVLFPRSLSMMLFFFPRPFVLFSSSLSPFIDYSFVSHSNVGVCSKIWASPGAGLPDPVAAPSLPWCEAAAGSCIQLLEQMGGCGNGWRPLGCRAGCGRLVYGKEGLLKKQLGEKKTF